uniref:Uncharacterized protein n=1 Tax=Timema poppense TaxID=170557 RepID=A0A7R9DMQ7_TIMPO|nr:unnamed protein product [Timema poppensis]
MENQSGKTTHSSPDRDSNLKLPVLGNLVQHGSSTLANYVTEEKPPPVHPTEYSNLDLPVLSSRAQHDRRVSQLRHRGGACEWNATSTIEQEQYPEIPPRPRENPSKGRTPPPTSKIDKRQECECDFHYEPIAHPNRYPEDLNIQEDKPGDSYVICPNYPQPNQNNRRTPHRSVKVAARETRPRQDSPDEPSSHPIQLRLTRTCSGRVGYFVPCPHFPLSDQSDVRPSSGARHGGIRERGCSNRPLPLLASSQRQDGNMGQIRLACPKPRGQDKMKQTDDRNEYQTIKEADPKIHPAVYCCDCSSGLRSPQRYPSPHRAEVPCPKCDPPPAKNERIDYDKLCRPEEPGNLPPPPQGVKYQYCQHLRLHGAASGQRAEMQTNHPEYGTDPKPSRVWDRSKTSWKKQETRTQTVVSDTANRSSLCEILASSVQTSQVC